MRDQRARRRPVEAAPAASTVPDELVEQAGRHNLRDHMPTAANLRLIETELRARADVLLNEVKTPLQLLGRTSAPASSM